MTRQLTLAFPREPKSRSISDLKSTARRPRPDGDQRYWVSFMAPSQAEFEAMLAEDGREVPR